MINNNKAPRGGGARANLAERRAGGGGNDSVIDSREKSVTAREELSHVREETADRRDRVAHDREQAVYQREHIAAAREKANRQRESADLALDLHVVQLQQANEHLVITTVEAQIMAEEIQRAKEQMGHMAHHDFLTDLPNRVLLMERLSRAIGLAKRRGTRLAVLFLDLDRFKVINDSLGHAVGDTLLQAVARRLLASVRATDTASRQGGDEFVVLLSEITDERAVCEVVDNMCKEIGAPYALQDQTVHIGVTVGISMYPDDSDDASTLIRNADVAMYHGKNRGRDQYHFFRADMNARAVERQRMEADLYRALDQHEFVLHYQPKVNLDSGAIIGSEALLRWVRPELGVMAPGGFIPVAEACGLIVPIGRWVLGEACAQVKRWRDAGLHPGSVAVNISAPEFQDPDFVARVRHLLEATGVAPACLELEITESILMRDALGSAAILRELKEMGVLLAVDDFGTGYSSLSYLRQFPIDVLKIDQSFVRDIGAPHDNGVIVSAVIAMGNSLGQRVIAEGVEHETQLIFLKEHHCDEGQGYLFSRPLSAADFGALLAAGIG
jgi:diguanylate cyclase (GGDEF)-like protein